MPIVPSCFGESERFFVEPSFGRKILENILATPSVVRAKDPGMNIIRHS
jgi:hypothetical protein